MHYITFDFLGQHRYGSAFHEYLRLRKGFFVDDLGWDIPHNEDVEMDQYDNPTAHYCLVMRNGEVVGGARAMSTAADLGSAHLHAPRRPARQPGRRSRPRSCPTRSRPTRSGKGADW